MTSENVKPALIENDARRKAAYRRNKNALLIKARKLSTLCDTETCVIINNPYNTQPDVWPSLPAAQKMMSKFKRMPVMEQSKSMLDQESFTRKRIVQVVGQANKLRESNKDKELTEMMYRCLTGQGVQNLGMEDVNRLGMLLVQNIMKISERIEKMANGEGSSKMAEVGSGKEVAPMEEQKAAVDFGLEAMQRPQGFGEWIDEHISLVSGVKMMMPFGDQNNGS